jgi:muconolactone delta-isomerase
MLEPIIIPKLLIHFADFPYMSLFAHWAPNPLVLMRFGTSIRQLFIRDNWSVRLCMTLGTVCKMASWHQLVLSRLFTVAIWRIVGHFADHPLFIVSNNLLQLKEWTRLGCVIFIKATTSKICSHGTSSIAHAKPSQPPWCLPTVKVSGPTWPPSILARRKFDRYVVTRFLADSDFHGHRPTVLTCALALMRVVGLVP